MLLCSDMTTATAALPEQILEWQPENHDYACSNSAEGMEQIHTRASIFKVVKHVDGFDHKRNLNRKSEPHGQVLSQGHTIIALGSRRQKHESQQAADVSLCVLDKFLSIALPHEIDSVTGSGWLTSTEGGGICEWTGELDGPASGCRRGGPVAESFGAFTGFASVTVCTDIVLVDERST